MPTNGREPVLRSSQAKKFRLTAGALIGFAVLIGVVSLVPVKGDEPEQIGIPSTGEELAVARGLFDRGLYAAAQAPYLTYLRSHPNDLQARSELVYAFALQGKDKLAAGQVDAFSLHDRTIEFSRAEIILKLAVAYARVGPTIEIQVVRDERGDVQGITTENVESISVAVELGLQNGDVLTSINNEPVDSRAKAEAIVTKYSNSPLFRIGIQRDGEPIVLYYILR